MNKKITRMKLGEGLDEDRTDWKRLKAMTEDDIDCSDIPELDETFFQNAKVIMPKNKQQITVRLDADILEWLKSKGIGYQTRMNAMLRAMMEHDIH